MLFWIVLAVVLVIVVVLVGWAVRGIAGRAHEPGTTRLD